MVCWFADMHYNIMCISEGVVVFKITFVWEMMLCVLVGTYHCVGRICGLQFQLRGRTEQAGRFIGNITYFSTRLCIGTSCITNLQQACFLRYIICRGFIYVCNYLCGVHKINANLEDQIHQFEWLSSETIQQIPVTLTCTKLSEVSLIFFAHNTRCMKIKQNLIRFSENGPLHRVEHNTMYIPH